MYFKDIIPICILKLKSFKVNISIPWVAMRLLVQQRTSKPAVGNNEAAYRLAAAAVKLATGDPEEACATGSDGRMFSPDFLGGG